MAVSKTNVSARDKSKHHKKCDKCGKEMNIIKRIGGKTEGMYWVCECGASFHKGKSSHLEDIYIKIR